MLTVIRDLLMAVAAAIGYRVRRGAALGGAIISRLKGSPTGARQASYHELDRLAGSWTREEADAFDLALHEQRTVNPNASR